MHQFFFFYKSSSGTRRWPDLKKTPQTPLPGKFQINLFRNFIHCTKQTWNLLDTDVTELEKQMDFWFPWKKQQRLPRGWGKKTNSEHYVLLMFPFPIMLTTVISPASLLCRIKPIINNNNDHGAGADLSYRRSMTEPWGWPRWPLCWSEPLPSLPRQMYWPSRTGPSPGWPWQPKNRLKNRTSHNETQNMTIKTTIQILFFATSSTSSSS